MANTLIEDMPTTKLYLPAHLDNMQRERIKIQINLTLRGTTRQTPHDINVPKTKLTNPPSVSCETPNSMHNTINKPIAHPRGNGGVKTLINSTDDQHDSRQMYPERRRRGGR